MKPDKYTVAYRQSIDDLSQALEEKEALEDRLQEVIAKVQDFREAAYSLGNLCNADPRTEYPNLFLEDANPDVGFTDAVRATFNPGIGLSPVQVRDKLKERGFKLDNYKNPLASIHTILKRLAKNDELLVDSDDEGPTLYFLSPMDEATAKIAEALRTGPMPTVDDAIKTLRKRKKN